MTPVNSFDTGVTNPKNPDLAVLVVDLQADFTQAHQGSMAVEGSDLNYLDQVSKAVRSLRELGLKVFATQDCHPKGHVSFATTHPGKDHYTKIELQDGRTQILWPDHCVEGEPGCQVLLAPEHTDLVMPKGKHPAYDSYSGFKDDGGSETGLARALLKQGVKRLLTFGIASDYCVKATVLDGLDAGFEMFVIQDLCRGVQPETTDKAWQEMQKNGAQIWPSLDLEKVRQ
jgi:nicotinamidase/pyrazinamidase